MLRGSSRFGQVGGPRRSAPAYQGVGGEGSDKDMALEKLRDSHPGRNVAVKNLSAKRSKWPCVILGQRGLELAGEELGKEKTRTFAERKATLPEVSERRAARGCRLSLRESLHPSNPSQPDGESPTRFPPFLERRRVPESRKVF